MIYTAPLPPYRSGNDTADLAALYEWCAAAVRRLKEGLITLDLTDLTEGQQALNDKISALETDFAARLSEIDERLTALEESDDG